MIVEDYTKNYDVGSFQNHIIDIIKGVIRYLW